MARSLLVLVALHAVLTSSTRSESSEETREAAMPSLQTESDASAKTVQDLAANASDLRAVWWEPEKCTSKKKTWPLNCECQRDSDCASKDCTTSRCMS
mmetsp:Transcript_21525/g.38594  ORF Transcript_21525/g.38594 Transcript_21525/m.38594 type:complete len:98 (+) Transcript_21525:66-359(+)